MAKNLYNRFGYTRSIIDRSSKRFILIEIEKKYEYIDSLIQINKEKYIKMYETVKDVVFLENDEQIIEAMKPVLKIKKDIKNRIKEITKNIVELNKLKYGDEYNEEEGDCDNEFEPYDYFAKRDCFNYFEEDDNND